MGEVVAASSGPVVIAGSVDSDERIEAVQRSGAWAFTVGSAVFDHAFPAPASAAAQVDHVLRVARELAATDGPAPATSATEGAGAGAASARASSEP